MSFEIQLEAITQSMLTEKIVETIKKLGNPQQIKYGRRVGTVTVWDTSTLIYSETTMNEGLKAENKALQEKLDIAVKALEEYAKVDWWDDCITLDDKQTIHPKCAWLNNGYETAQAALAKIKEIK